MGLVGKKELFEREEKCLAQYAAKSNSEFLTKRQMNEYDIKDTLKQEYRLPFQRDRDRIIHSRAFRRLMHKTQIFNANKGDHYRNRLTHTLEVSQIARSIGKVMGLNDELIEAIALGHDIGHTPFGHTGERTLHLIISGRFFSENSDIYIGNYGGFKHNYQSLQIIDNVEKSSENYYGMNLTLAVREGILKHTGCKMKVKSKNCNDKSEIKEDINYSSIDLSDIDVEKPSFTLEGQVVAIADEIAQSTHDLEDSIRSKIIRIEDIRNEELIKKICEIYKINLKDCREAVDIRNILIKNMVGYLIDDVCKASNDKIEKDLKSNYPKFCNKNDVFTEKYIIFSNHAENNVQKMHSKLTKTITNLVIASQEVSQSDARAEYIINRLFKAYYVHPQQLPDYILRRYFTKKGHEFNRISIIDRTLELQQDSEFIRLICDHISGMTDQYAAREYKKLYEPEYY